jgi:small-conductance mechanosensitive channel
VSLGDHYGEVTSIGLRSTRLVTPNDTAVVVPNFTAVNESLANNNTSAAEMLVIVEFHVAPESDTGRAVEIVEEALLSSRYVYVSDDHPCTVLVSDEQYYQTLTGRAYVNDLRNERLFQTDVTRRVLAAFDEAGIESPTAPTTGAEMPPGR